MLCCVFYCHMSMTGFEGDSCGECAVAVLRLITGLLCFSVDEYIAIAKEKHGYNMEQVTVHFLWKAELATGPPGRSVSCGLLASLTGQKAVNAN